MDLNRHPLGDLRAHLNLKARNFSTKNNHNVKGIIVTIQNDKTTNKRPADLSTDSKPTKKVNTTSSTPILIFHQIFNTKVSEYIENSQKVTDAHQHYLAGSSLECVNKNLENSQLNGYNSFDYKNCSGLEHSNVYNNFKNIRTIHIERNIHVNHNSTKTLRLPIIEHNMENNMNQKEININYDIILQPNTKPTRKMQERMDMALEAILYITNDIIVKQQNVTKSDLKLFSGIYRNVINDRIINVLIGQLVRSRSDIIDRYLKRYPKEKDAGLLKLYNCMHGNTIPYLIETDNPAHYFKVNMMKLINIKMRKIINIVDKMFKDSRQKLRSLEKTIETNCNIPGFAIQERIHSKKYTNCLLEREFSRFMAKFNIEIIYMILNIEFGQAIRMNVLQR